MYILFLVSFFEFCMEEFMDNKMNCWFALFNLEIDSRVMCLRN